MKSVMIKPFSLYVRARRWLFSKQTWNSFYEFVSLPELKCCKTIAFVISVIL